jgi:NAD(P)-dependent dehydrogenase (short-subunit alcohol dehydrogenase family)
MLATNLEGAILTSRALLRACVRSRLRNRDEPSTTAGLGGRCPPPSKCIINISSLLAVKGGTGAVTYAASKAGLLGLTRSTAVEAASSLKGLVVRSNAIVPGYIETSMIERETFSLPDIGIFFFLRKYRLCYANNYRGLSDFSDDQVTRLKESIPLKRFGDPQEVADAAVFLAENEYASNCVLNLDGGLSAV